MVLVRSSYHSDVKIAVQLDILPEKYRRVIPRSTLHRFKHTDYSRLIGNEYSQVLNHLELLKEISQSRAALHVAGAVLRIVSFMNAIQVHIGQASAIKSPVPREKVAAFVERMTPRLPRKQVLKLVGITNERFRSWSKGIKICPSSPLNRCRKNYPHQLSVRELRAISKAFRNPEISHWPATSIAWKLITEQSIHAHVSTITGYAKRLGLINPTHFHKSRKRGSFSATAPNQAWHLDATIIMTDLHEKAYLQLVIDNYSRKIIAWEISGTISGLQTTTLLKKAFASLSGAVPESFDLIVDGGPENNNSRVSAFLNNTPIRKLVAKVDVAFSNSMIEAVNKILKYQYLFRKSIPDLAHIVEFVRKAIEDYNSRPHYFLRGVTPNDAYTGKVFNREEYRKGIESARAKRIAENRKSCAPCVPFNLEEAKE
jgi:Integrase core domain.